MLGAPRGGGTGPGAGRASAAKRLSREAWLKLKLNAPQVSADLKARLAGPAEGDAVREAQLVVTLIHHPQLYANHEDAVLDLDHRGRGAAPSSSHAQDPRLVDRGGNVA